MNPHKLDSWAAYKPNARSSWSLRRVVHLHRRAGFAATWSEIQRDLKEGAKASVDRVFGSPQRKQGAEKHLLALRTQAENFEQTADLLADAAVSSQDPGRLKAWWVYRMLFSPDPLGERLTLMWHNHFATSNLKANDLSAMRRQNEIFREHARAPFGKLLHAVLRDPAVLVWLDAPVNRKGHPNENLARELMELFTLGIGHYSESDVKEGARALTGWTINDGKFEELPKQHDDGEKTLLGRKGKWTGADFVKILLDQPATAERLAFRLCEMLMGEKAVDTAAIKALADSLRQHDLDIGWAVETVLRSEAFFADANIGNRIVGPVEYVIGSVRALELLDPPPSTLVLAEWLARLGQDLFYPPNVGGWAGGRSWISTQTIIGRANFAAALVEGKNVGRFEPLDACSLARRHGGQTDADGLVTHYAELLIGGKLPSSAHSRIAAEEMAQRAVALLLACPETQLG